MSEGDEYVVYSHNSFELSENIIVTVNPTLATHPLLFPDFP